jgi:hypothetical protein
MKEPLTCGRGLAEHSLLPAKLAKLIASMADNLEAHMKALDLRDEHARREHGAYLKLAAENRRVASELRAISDEMASYRDLPMGAHDDEAMNAPNILEHFEDLVKCERDVFNLLEKTMEHDQRMLVEMVVAHSAT